MPKYDDDTDPQRYPLGSLHVDAEGDVWAVVDKHGPRMALIDTEQDCLPAARVEAKYGPLRTYGAVWAEKARQQAEPIARKFTEALGAAVAEIFPGAKVESLTDADMAGAPAIPGAVPMGGLRISGKGIPDLACECGEPECPSIRATAAMQGLRDAIGAHMRAPVAADSPDAVAFSALLSTLAETSDPDAALAAGQEAYATAERLAAAARIVDEAAAAASEGWRPEQDTPPDHSPDGGMPGGYVRGVGIYPAPEYPADSLAAKARDGDAS